MESKVASSLDTIESLQRIASRLNAILPGLEDGTLKEDLLQMRTQCHAAIAFYTPVATPGQIQETSGVVRAVSDATLGLGAVGLSALHVTEADR